MTGYYWKGLDPLVEEWERSLYRLEIHPKGNGERVLLNLPCLDATHPNSTL